MRHTYTNTATVLGRGLRAVVAPGCLSVTDTYVGTIAPTSPKTAVPALHMTAVPAVHGFAAFTKATNAMKQGSHPPRDSAALN